MRLQFTKMHGLGNDFVVVDGLTSGIELAPGHVRALADRRFGVGCDQVLLIEAARDAGADLAYRVFNADGTEAGQCGNGVRCVARYAMDRGLVEKARLVAQAPDRLVTVEAEGDETLRVDMGPPRLEPAQIPMLACARQDAYRIGVMGRQLTIGAVSMGNPHAVVSVDDVDDAPVACMGRAIGRHKLFPEGANAGFMQIVDPSHIKLRVYERGVGETLACGSGACAAVVVGRLSGRLEAGVRVDLPGGQLAVDWPGEGEPVWMRGPASYVFEGSMEL